MATNNAVNTNLSGQTGSGAFVGGTNPTINSSTFSGRTGVVDSVGLTSTVSSASQITLTNTSSSYQLITGSTTQSVALPNATTMSPGQYFIFNNQSTAAVNVQTTFPAVILTVGAGQVAKLTLLTNAVSAGTWQINDAILTCVQQNFTAVASGTYTPTSGMAFIIVEMCGSGGGSGGTAVTTLGNVTVGGAGAPGGYLKFKMTAAQVGASLSYTLGVAGSGGAAGANVGFTGSSAVFGSWTAKGGNGGVAGVAGGTAVKVNGSSATSNTVGTGQVIFNTTSYSGNSAAFVAGTNIVMMMSNGGTNPLSFACSVDTPYYIMGTTSTSGNANGGAQPTGYGYGGYAIGSYGTYGNIAGITGAVGAIFVTEYVYI